MHAEPVNIDVQRVIDAGPVEAATAFTRSMWALVILGVVVFFAALWSGFPRDVLWASYYTSALYWMGLGFGGVMTTVIYQIVRAEWSPPVRRLGESHIAFIPWAILLLLAGAYFGREELFPWATRPFPGREEYMEPAWVFTRFTILLFAFYFCLRLFVKWSLRGDIALAREKCSNAEHWRGYPYSGLVQNWGGDAEYKQLQVKMSRFAPVIVALYAIVYTLFATEMLNSMDAIWFSNMFGGFQFLGNIYMGWAATVLLSLWLIRRSAVFASTIQRRQFWDLGMLCLGFSMLWAYTFFSQFLPQWYSNMPEETQWLILRTRDFPWKTVSWVTFGMCFVVPFLSLLSEDVKKSPKAFTCVCLIILAGVWLEKYVLVMPQVSPQAIPFGLLDICIFLGFLGVYGLCIQGFLGKYPFSPVSHPLSKGDRDW